MDFEELMYSPVTSRDIGRSFIMPQAGFGYGLGPAIYPYYGLQPLQPQPMQDAYVKSQPENKSKKIARTVGKIVLGTLAVLGFGALLTKGSAAVKTPKLSAFFGKVGTFFKNAFTKAKGAVKTGWGKVSGFFKNIFKKAPKTPATP